MSRRRAAPDEIFDKRDLSKPEEWLQEAYEHLHRFAVYAKPKRVSMLSGVGRGKKLDVPSTVGTGELNEIRDLVVDFAGAAFDHEWEEAQRILEEIERLEEDVYPMSAHGSTELRFELEELRDDDAQKIAEALEGLNEGLRLGKDAIHGILQDKERRYSHEQELNTATEVADYVTVDDVAGALTAQKGELCADCRREEMKRREATCEGCGRSITATKPDSWVASRLEELGWEYSYQDEPSGAWAMQAPDKGGQVTYKPHDVIGRDGGYEAYRGTSYKNEPEELFKLSEAEDVVDFAVSLGYQYQPPVKEIQERLEEYGEEPLQRISREHPNDPLVQKLQDLLSEAKGRLRGSIPDHPVRGKKYLMEIPDEIASIATDQTWDIATDEKWKEKFMDDFSDLGSLDDKVRYAMEPPAYI